MTAIALYDVVFRYPRGGFALKCPFLELPAGEVTLIAGPNGSGKTTLSKLMCGILRPQQGRISVFGSGIEGLSLGEIGRRVGYSLPESFPPALRRDCLAGNALCPGSAGGGSRHS